MTARRIRLDHPLLDGKTGRGVRVAVVDSGAVSGHPHVGIVTEGVAIGAEGESGDFRDRIGHGTAVTAAIREKAPAAEIVAVRVFDRSLATSAEVLARAIVWAAERDVALINLSLGTSNPARTAILADAVSHAVERGALIVSAREQDGLPSLPGSLPHVAAVEVDWEIERDELVVDGRGTGIVFRASGYPRPIPGVPRERNLSGISFAVANVTGFLARAVEGRGRASTLDMVAADLLVP